METGKGNFYVVRIEAFADPTGPDLVDVDLVHTGPDPRDDLAAGKFADHGAAQIGRYDHDGVGIGGEPAHASRKGSHNLRTAQVRHGQDEIRSILDLGTGSGCIAISLAKNLPDVAVFACDVSEPAIEVARQNAEHHGVLDRIGLRLGDLFEPWEPARRFDLIVSNPPYVAESELASLPANVRDFEPRAALFAGEDGLDVLRRLIDQAPQRLTPGGHLLAEMAYNQAAAVRSLLDEMVWRDIVTYPDDLGHERVVHARRHANERTQVT